MKSTDFIKLYRGIVDTDLYKDGKTFRLYLHLLLFAVRNTTKYGKVTIERGQCISTSRDLSVSLGISTKYITESIQRLKESGKIKTERTERGTIFTVVEYDDYNGISAKPVKKETERKGNGIGCTDF